MKMNDVRPSPKVYELLVKSWVKSGMDVVIVSNQIELLFENMISLSIKPSLELLNDLFIYYIAKQQYTLFNILLLKYKSNQSDSLDINTLRYCFELWIEYSNISPSVALINAEQLYFEMVKSGDGSAVQLADHLRLLQCFYNDLDCANRVSKGYELLMRIQANGDIPSIEIYDMLFSILATDKHKQSATLKIANDVRESMRIYGIEPSASCLESAIMVWSKSKRADSAKMIGRLFKSMLELNHDTSAILPLVILTLANSNSVSSVLQATELFLSGTDTGYFEVLRPMIVCKWCTLGYPQIGEVLLTEVPCTDVSTSLQNGTKPGSPLPVGSLVAGILSPYRFSFHSEIWLWNTVLACYGVLDRAIKPPPSSSSETSSISFNVISNPIVAAIKDIVYSNATSMPSSYFPSSDAVVVEDNLPFAPTADLSTASSELRAAYNAERVYQKMRDRGVVPDKWTYSTLASVWSAAGYPNCAEGTIELALTNQEFARYNCIFLYSAILRGWLARLDLTSDAAARGTIRTKVQEIFKGICQHYNTVHGDAHTNSPRMDEGQARLDDRDLIYDAFSSLTAPQRAIDLDFDVYRAYLEFLSLLDELPSENKYSDYFDRIQSLLQSQAIGSKPYTSARSMSSPRYKRTAARFDTRDVFLSDPMLSFTQRLGPGEAHQGIGRLDPDQAQSTEYSSIAERAVDLFQVMIKAGLLPDLACYDMLFTVFVNAPSSISWLPDKGLDIVRNMKELGISQPSQSIYLKLLRLWARAARVDAPRISEGVFRVMVSANLSPGLPGSGPLLSTEACHLLLECWARSVTYPGSIAKASDVYAMIRTEKVPLTADIYTTLAQAWCNQGKAGQKKGKPTKMAGSEVDSQAVVTQIESYYLDSIAAGIAPSSEFMKLLLLSWVQADRNEDLVKANLLLVATSVPSGPLQSVLLYSLSYYIRAQWNNSNSVGVGSEALSEFVACLSRPIEAFQASAASSGVYDRDTFQVLLSNVLKQIQATEEFRRVASLPWASYPLQPGSEVYGAVVTRFGTASVVQYCLLYLDLLQGALGCEAMDATQVGKFT